MKLVYHFLEFMISFIRLISIRFRLNIVYLFNTAENSLTDKLTSVSEKLGAYERQGGELMRRGSEDMLDDLHEIDAASIIDEPRVFNAIACKTRFGTKVDPYSALATSVGSVLCLSSSVGSLTPRSPLTTPKSLTTPKNNHIDFLLADKNNFAEAEDIEQVFTFFAQATGFSQIHLEFRTSVVRRCWVWVTDCHSF